LIYRADVALTTAMRATTTIAEEKNPAATYESNAERSSA
jgi:hypothetical protein